MVGGENRSTPIFAPASDENSLEENAAFQELSGFVQTERVRDVLNSVNSDGEDEAVMEKEDSKVAAIPHTQPASGLSDERIDESLQTEILRALDDRDNTKTDAERDEIQWAILLSIQEQQESDAQKSPARELEDYRNDLEVELALEVSRLQIDNETKVDLCLEGSLKTGECWQSSVLDRICTDDETLHSNDDMQSGTSSSTFPGLHPEETTEGQAERLLAPEYVELPTIEHESYTTSHMERISLADSEGRSYSEDTTVNSSTFDFVDEEASEPSSDYVLVSSCEKSSDENSDGSWHDDFSR